MTTGMHSESLFPSLSLADSLFLPISPPYGTSLVVQWFRTLLPIQGARV